MTLLIASLLDHSTGDLLTGAEGALRQGADVVELRLDGLTQGWNEIPNLVKRLPPYRWVATCRPTEEGGHYDGPLVDRVSLLLAVGSAAPGFIDFEFQDWLRSANIRQKLELATAVRPGDVEHEHLQQAGGRLILSRHFQNQPDDVSASACEMAGADFRGPMKVVWPARDIRDNFSAFNIIRQNRRPAVALCTGEAGLASRVLAGKFGAFASYAAVMEDKPTAPGQVGLRAMLETYRWRSVGPATQWFGVIGYPVAQSLGKHVHNWLFTEQGIDGVYIPLPIKPESGALEAVLDELEHMGGFGFAGSSVTIPHKEGVRRWLGSRVDSLSARIGAVNTLYKKLGMLHGTNTDYSGFSESLRGRIEKPLPYGRGSVGDDRGLVKHSEIGNWKLEILRGWSVDVLGAGGAARAVVCALCDLGADVTLFNRTGSKAAALAAEFGCRHADWDDRNKSNAPLLINTTSIGMGNPEQSPVEPQRLASRPMVMDLVFKPLETRLLAEARRVGCHTIDGLAMYAHQAARQFAAWTGQTVSADGVRALALSKMTE